MSGLSILLSIIVVISCSVNAEKNDPVNAEQNNYWMEPPGRLINIGAYRLHISCMGKDNPVVVLDAGLGGFSLEWTKVQRELADKVTICAYDRAGYGWSDAGPSPRVTDQIVEELHALLTNAGLKSPYILVGHSFGGYNVQYFAKLYPELTAGLVLIDSSHPEQSDRLPDIPARREKSESSEMFTFFRGQSTFKYYPEDVRLQVMRMMSIRKTYETYQREFANFTVSGNQVSQSGRLPDRPLVVITRGKRVWPEDPYGDSLEAEWKKMQQELVKLTPSGRQIIADNSGHLIHLEQPDLVAAAILSVVEEVRQKNPDILQQGENK